MTDRERLEKMMAELPDGNYFRSNVLSQLIDSTDEETGNLRPELYIPHKEIDVQFMKDVIKELGYDAEYNDDDYNPFHECYCYQIYLYS